MFEGFNRPSEVGTGRRFAISTLTTVLAYAAIGSAVLWAAQRTATQGELDKEVEVKFKTPDEPAKPRSPPPAPPPVIPEGMKVNRSRAARPAPSMVAPKAISDQKLAEAKPGDAIEVGDVGGVEGGNGTGPVTAEPQKPEPPPPPPPAPKRSEPINLPEDAEPAMPDDGNVVPEFPDDMKKLGRENIVILKIVVTEHGAVGKIEVLRGEEPFVSAALAAVKTWRYSPALVEGKPTASFKTVKIPFRIKT